MLEIENLTKQFYTLTALDRVTLSIPDQGILGILGPNGAGKTTLFKILTDILKADGGTVRPRNGRWPTIGYKPERLLFPDTMRVDQYLRMIAAMHNTPRQQVEHQISSVLERVGLTQEATLKISQCSKGMRQKLGLAQAIFGQPDLLILDEPTDGLDPHGQKQLLDTLESLNADGMTILLATHQLEDVTAVCSDVAILNHGKMIYTNPLTKAIATQPNILILVDDYLDRVRGLLTTLHPDILPEGTTLILRKGALALRRDVLLLLLNAGYDILNISQKRATLAEVYAEVTA